MVVYAKKCFYEVALENTPTVRTPPQIIVTAPLSPSPHQLKS